MARPLPLQLGLSLQAAVQRCVCSAGAAGPASCYLTGFLHLTGKEVGSKGILKGCIRAKAPMMCAQGALGRYMVVRWTVGKEELPGPLDPAWAKLPMWPSRRGTPLGYLGHWKRVKDMFGSVGIESTKVTHAMRVFAARLADEAGLSEEVSGGAQRRGSIGRAAVATHDADGAGMSLLVSSSSSWTQPHQLLKSVTSLTDAAAGPIIPLPTRLLAS
jgi:hypothetical protein